ncbi:MAG: hypothetical protein ACK40O_12735, partial [Allosphingosinicella sp.]
MPAKAGIHAAPSPHAAKAAWTPAFAGVTAWLCALFLLAAPAAAQTDRPEYRRALAAGYVASFTCSNWFNAGVPAERTRADDLRGTYAELQPLFAELTPEIDRTRKVVSVAYDPA